MKKIKCYSSFEEAEKDDIEYYSNLDPNLKIVELERIRESYFNLIGLSDEDRKIKKILQIDDMKLNQK